jgi:hypothetical protein
MPGARGLRSFLLEGRTVVRGWVWHGKSVITALAHIVACAAALIEHRECSLRKPDQDLVLRNWEQVLAFWRKTCSESTLRIANMPLALRKRMHEFEQEVACLRDTTREGNETPVTDCVEEMVIDCAAEPVSAGLGEPVTDGPEEEEMVIDGATESVTAGVAEPLTAGAA